MTYSNIPITLKYKGFPYTLEGEVLIPKYLLRDGKVIKESGPYTEYRGKRSFLGT